MRSWLLAIALGLAAAGVAAAIPMQAAADAARAERRPALATVAPLPPPAAPPSTARVPVLAPATFLPPPRVPRRPQAGAGRVEILHLRSPDGAPHDVWVYRPGVADSASLPVLYFLHGSPGLPSDVFNVGLAQVMDAAVANGAPPMVIAAPDGNGTAHPDSEWANAADGRDQLETFVISTVVQAVEGVHPRRRTERAIAGFSMGGFGAVNLASRHPDLFGQVSSIAGYFHIDDPDGVFGGVAQVQAANTPYDHLSMLGRVRLLLLDGDHDTEPVVEGEAWNLARDLTSLGIPVHLRIASGTHSWLFVKSQLPTVLAFFAEGFEGRA